MLGNMQAGPFEASQSRGRKRESQQNASLKRPSLKLKKKGWEELKC